MATWVIYENDSGLPSIEVRVEGETVWLTQAQLVELFDTSKANVSEHIKHIFEEDELQRDSVVRSFRTTAEAQYRKYQTQTLSKVEQAYLENITAAQKKVKIKSGSFIWCRVWE